MRLAIITIIATLAVAPVAGAEPSTNVNNPSAYAATDFPNFVTTIPVLSMDTSLGSLHFPSSLSGGPRFNDFNPGLGVELPLTPDYTLMGGVYKNSYDHASFYTGLAVTPWAWRLQPDNWKWLVRPGVLVGLVSGYDRSENPAAPLFSAGLLQIRDAQTGIGVNLIALPRMDGQAGFVGIQLVTPILP